MEIGEVTCGSSGLRQGRILDSPFPSPTSLYPVCDGGYVVDEKGSDDPQSSTRILGKGIASLRYLGSRSLLSCNESSRRSC